MLLERGALTARVNGSPRRCAVAVPASRPRAEFTHLNAHYLGDRGFIGRLPTNGYALSFLRCCKLPCS